MYNDEEQLPLYHVEDNEKVINYYVNQTKYKYKTKKSSKNKNRYYKNTKYQLNNNDSDDDKKLKPLKKIYNENKLIKYIINFVNILFNNKNVKVFYSFLILILVEVIEYYIDTLIDFFPIKFSISILCLIPYIIILLENEIFFQLNSTFELNFLIFLKFIILFNKNMNLKDIFMITICATLFDNIYIKKMHVSQYYYSLDGNINKKQYKAYIFESEIYFIIVGFVCCILVLFNLLKNKKLQFHLFDLVFMGIGEDFQNIYFFLLQYLILKKFIKFCVKYIFKYSENNKRKEKRFIINTAFIIFLLSEIFFINSLGHSFKNKISYILIIGLIIILYENIGFLIFVNLLIISFIIYGANYIIEIYFTQDIIFLIKNNLVFINISFALTITFIMTIFLLEKKQISNFYILIYQRIFKIKIIFDIWLIIKYIYSLYKYNPLNYVQLFLQTFKFFFLSFLFNYFLVLLAVIIKLNIYIEPKDVEYYFVDIIKFLNNKKIKGELFYGGSAPYVEIRLYKTFSNLSNFLKDDISKSNKKTKAFQKILYSNILAIFIFLCFIIDNFLIYFPIFFALIQFFSDSLNDIVFLISNKIFSIFYIVLEKANDTSLNNNLKRYKEDYIIQKYNKKIREKEMTIYIKKEKLKLIYLLLFFYLSIFWRKIFSYLFALIYEKFISFWQYKIFGKLEPLGNIIYQIIIMNYYNERERKYLIKEIIFLFLFLFPSSLAIIYSHYFEKKINFFFQNFILTSLLPLFYNLDILLVLLGFFNIFLMINIFAADEETYRNLKFWFFLFGIHPMNIYY